MNLYPHQSLIVKSLSRGMRYVVAAPRTGKTRPVIEFLRESERVLVLTKKAAVGGWESELKAMGVSGWTVTNYEKVKTKGWDKSIEWTALVCDEAHTLATFPKPNQLVKPIRALKVSGPRIGISATPCPESYSQLYHQDKALLLGLWEDRSFYKWHKVYGIPDLFRAHGRMLESYKKTKEAVWEQFSKVCCIVDRKQAMPDFVEAEDRKVPIEAPEIVEMCERLKTDQVIEVDGRAIVADTPMALAQKCAQICNGVVLDDQGEPLVVNTVKRDWVSKRFKGVKLAILTTFRAEVDSYGGGEDQKAFLEGNLERFVGNFRKYSSGVDLSPAEALIFTGCPWSALHWFQGKDRILRTDRVLDAPIYYPVIKGCVDEQIYDVVVGEKKDFVASRYVGAQAYT